MTRKKKVAIIHFHPVEFYPPIHNLLNYIEESESNIDVYFFSTKNDKGLATTQYKFNNDYRPTSLKSNGNRWLNLIKILYFNVFTLFKLILTKPDAILYYESISSFVPYILTRFFYPKIPVFIHYHEYTTPRQYAEEMKIILFFHSKESYLYTKASWISHTNHDRLELFRKDFIELNLGDKLKVLPNFPPLKWQKANNLIEHTIPKDQETIRMVYLGSLSTRSMYFKEISHWIIKQKGKFTLDIYSINLKEDVKHFLDEINTPFIKIKGSLRYDDIPSQLEKYDIGLILYNGATLNYVYNAPNKLFEYLICDLDVWFSDDLKGSFPYIREECYPKVLKVDFKSLDKFNWEQAISRKGLKYQPSQHFHENVLLGLISSINMV